MTAAAAAVAADDDSEPVVDVVSKNIFELVDARARTQVAEGRVGFTTTQRHANDAENLVDNLIVVFVTVIGNFNGENLGETVGKVHVFEIESPGVDLNVHVVADAGGEFGEPGVIATAGDDVGEIEE